MREQLQTAKTTTDYDVLYQAESLGINVLRKPPTEFGNVVM
jgi:hypothetical protein